MWIYMLASHNCECYLNYWCSKLHNLRNTCFYDSIITIGNSKAWEIKNGIGEYTVQAYDALRVVCVSIATWICVNVCVIDGKPESSKDNQCHFFRWACFLVKHVLTAFQSSPAGGAAMYFKTTVPMDCITLIWLLIRLNNFLRGCNTSLCTYKCRLSFSQQHTRLTANNSLKF